ncbi:MauE/DoxX family redox-associated membrane protein [Flavivirga jejuensis]|uniref:Methylamine utilisation protein MauE domain-containing protein n=1 Tax=Flavivirga jejuensis TaxID=870487 RepID=A0ABT8WPW2_9FLAO|nr:MauE/DoxX family redox-associated membrane protein [Flavivirga jejuensis]MDO5975200.1 hypothetical protein [Flavivirga jejuensis]
MIRSKIVYEDVPKTNSILFILLFVYTATSKSIGFTHFNTQLEGFSIIGDYATWVTWSVPIVQLVIAITFSFAAKDVEGASMNGYYEDSSGTIHQETVDYSEIASLSFVHTHGYY